jgi:exodeoxyribonuclease V beta subunit
MNNRDYNPIQIRNISQIDLDTHGVVEASAGTGKTYTIEHLVVELLKNKKVQSLDQILVVTFTEKAVGELKNRIRNIIRLSLEQEPSEILNSSYENFDSASIYTIHGFCNKILNDYAFENRKHLTNTLIDDRAVYEQELSHIKRDIWPDEYGDQLRSVLQLSGYPGSTGTGTSSWEDLVIDVALRYQLSGFDTIHPPLEPDILNNILTIQKKSSAYLDSLSLLVGTIDESDYKESALCIDYESLNINKKSKQSRLPLLIDLSKILSAHAKQTLSIKDLADFIIDYGSGDTGFNELNSKWNKPGPDFETNMPHLPAIIQVLENLRALDYSHLKTMLTVKTIHQLKHNGLKYKTENSFISYDDMITHVYSALKDESSSIANLLRKRYRYALVDEFQDTDMLQWAIFKAIFLESEYNRLFIIGDPKQAIYGFRGADINAYLLARDEMISAFNARFYSLSENWRSSPALISAFNKIFSYTNWFSNGTIQYLPSLYPENKKQELHSDPNSLILVNCGSASGTDARLRFSDYIAREINILITSNYACELNEIAILVTKWKEADAIEKTLKNASIKYSFYKKEGLYQTKEALELYYLLSAIANPHDTVQKKIAFTTRFYHIDKQSLFHVDNIPSDHPLYMLFEKWILLADEKNWSFLFQSFVEDTGILYRIESEDHDRQILNYKSIIQALEIEALRNNYCIHEVTTFLSKLMLNTVVDIDTSNIQKLDIDKPSVQILTMHASKGLEFKIVFIGGGFTKRDTSVFLTYHINNQRIFDLVKEERTSDLHDLERSHEEERLFYVAFTRARDRLYIPLFEPTKNSISKAGMIGNRIPKALTAVRNDPVTTLVEYDQIQSSSAIFQNNLSNQALHVSLPDPLFPEIDKDFHNRSVTVNSFSGLKMKLHGSPAYDTLRIEYGPGTPLTVDEDSTPTIDLPDDRPIKDSEGIPHGIESGLMLHEILEKIDFKNIFLIENPIEILGKNSTFHAIINTAIKNNLKNKYSDSDLLKSETAKIIWNTLHAPLDDSGLKLGNIDNKIHEVEFYYPTSHEGVPDNHDLISPAGYIHGFIDMIFEYNEKYYLADWKSNYIEEGYSYPMIEKNILDMHYDLQITIYTEALIRWLKRFKSDYTYNRHFGGVYYLYMRGIHPNKKGDGIFFYRPDREPDRG